MGEGSTRTVVSGLVKYIPLEEMQVNQLICFAIITGPPLFCNYYAFVFHLSNIWTRVLLFPLFVFLAISLVEQGRRVCVLCNLKPVAMRGIKSHAMVLAASNEDHTKVSIMSLSPKYFLCASFLQ